MVCWLLFTTVSAINPSPAASRYVDAANPNPVPPYTNWGSAATVIQDAVDVASAGDVVLVTNGVYATGGALISRVTAMRPLTLQSVNGPRFTLIVGNSPSGDTALRCVYLTNGCSLIGFTLTNGATHTGPDPHENSGGGVFCEPVGAVVSNCIFVSNSVAGSGGGAYNGTILNSTFIGNSATNDGGGAWGSGLSNCFLSSNVASQGGGCFNSRLTNCTVARNSCVRYGGGIGASYAIGCFITSNSATYGAGCSGGQIERCFVISNTAAASGGGVYYAWTDNCLICSNWAPAGAGVSGGMITNCTVVRNNVDFSYFGSGTLDVQACNSIVYYNDPYNVRDTYGGFLFINCCTTPVAPGPGNFDDAPLFVNLAAGNFHLSSNSPCINSGTTAYSAVGTDLDDSPRIVGGTLDVGTYEFQSPVSLISYQWLARFHLPMDGSADLADSDGDGVSNWREWLADTDPTNAESVLNLKVLRAGGSAGVTISWPGTGTRYYGVERSTSPFGPFQNIRTNIANQAGTLMFTDTNGIGPGPYFYRIQTFRW